MSNNPPNDPNDPTLVVEVRSPGVDTWLPQMVVVAGEPRFALVKTSMSDRVKSKLEQVYGVGRVRLMPAEGYQPDPKAEEARLQLREESLKPGAPVESGQLEAAVITLYIRNQEGDAVSVVCGPDGSVHITKLGRDTGELADDAMWSGDGDDPRQTPLRNAMSVIFGWATARLREVGKGAELQSPTGPAADSTVH